ncbi:Uu.00g067870.m01.CDS01 [Anthostomella pinea]|uniref:Uu.00g067870.m01.CDS01 n=1 Tax=Anthostomella pinea TaxID=933095 RepID=A0AAI8YL06_9PEZI|nr:Uu.00g067870.m01.CDS01 [Anthostomella pinea]
MAHAQQDIEAILAQDGAMPIAIVGVSGRFPGDASTPEKLWDMVSQGRSALTEVPKERYNVDGFYHPSGEHQGTTTTRMGHFIESDVGLFDAPFFKISAQEAHAMDPQQRLALELAYEALESAGMTISDIAKSTMGCYMATCVRDYAAIRAIDPDDYPRYEANGSMGTAMISNRISWFFDIKGASLTLDTACSSSLVALHLAVQAIRTGESNSALVGATNLILMPHTSNHLSTLQFLSPTGKSQSFDHRANGYSRGEGVSFIVVKSLADALRDGDVIRAVVRGTSVTQDGRTPGINLPSSESQEELIRAAYANAVLGTEDTTYFEAHGPGTPAGDPLETSAIAKVFGKHRSPEDPLHIGSVKSNIGHLEAGAGLAGLTKALYALEKGQIPPNIWFEKPHPKIHLKEWNLAVPTSLVPWPTDGLRRASINSFGYGGTNAHCILDDAYHYLSSRGLTGKHNTATVVPRLEKPADGLDSPDTDSASDTGVVNSEVASAGDSGTPVSDISEDLGEISSTPQLLVWSSHEQSGIGRTAANLQAYLKETDSLPSEQPTLLKRLGYTLSARRSRLPWSSFVVASDLAETVKELETPSKPLRPAVDLCTIFVFTGQGAQWFGMGRELMAYRTYRTRMEEAAAHLKTLGCEWDLIEELSASQADSRVNEPQISQPACTAVQVGLVDLLKEWGVTPSVTLGHSSGEIGAAYAKGALSRETAWTVAYHRGRLSSSLQITGAMLAVALGEDEVKPFIDQCTTDPKPVVACINSPQSVTLSGSVEGIDQAVEIIGSQAWARKLLVKTPYHSPFMRALAEPYYESMQGITGGTPTATRMFSSVTGKEIDDADLINPQYWVDNMVCAVKFSHALDAALNDEAVLGKSLAFIEVGPHGALQGPIKQILKAQKEQPQDFNMLSLLMRKEDAIRTTLKGVGIIFQKGYPVDVSKANHVDSKQEMPAHLVDLPPFSWNHNSRYWYETAMSTAYRNRKEPKHDLLGARDVFSNDGEPAWRNYLRPSELPWARHHGVGDKFLFSAAGFLTMVVEAVRQTAEPGKTIEAIQFRDVFPGAAIILNDSEDSPIETKLQLRNWRLASRSLTTYWKEFSISSRTRDGTWSQHSTGLVSLKYASDNHASTFADENASFAETYRQEYSRIKDADLKPHSGSEFYSKFEKMGMQWGETFQNLVESSAAGNAVTATLKVPDTKSWMPANVESPNVIHPATLDGIFHMLLACDGVEKITVPKYIERIYLSTKLPTEPGSKLQGFAEIKEKWADGTNGTVVLSDEKWDEPLLIFEGLKSTDYNSDSKDEEDAEAKIEAVKKLGAYSTWHVDVENSPEATKAILEKAVSSAPQILYDTVQDLEWGAYIVCKRMTQRFTDEDSKRMAPHHLVFYNYMKRQCDLGKAGELPCQTPEWSTASKAVEDEVLSRVAAASLEGKMMCRINDNVESVLLGEIEPWELMNHDNALNDMYRYGLSDERTPAVQCEYISRLSHKRPLRILEVGAGTGSATSRILAALGPEVAGRLTKYTYTDISGSFFAEAAEEFKDYRAMMDFKVLNIENEPAQQGFEEGSYDVVVAFQVLHATSSISTTLANCKRLLKPGGHLIATELTSKIARRSVVFGVLAGWWLGEADDRLWGPELSEEGWDERLKAVGFSGVDLCFRDREDVGWSSSLVASTVPLESEVIPVKNVTIIKSSEESSHTKALIEQLSKKLTADGATVEEKTLSELASADLTKSRCIVATELDKPILAHLDQSEFDAIKNVFARSEGTLWLTNGGFTIDSRDPELNMITGLARTVRGEDPQIRLTCLDLDPDLPLEAESVTDTVLKVLKLNGDASNADHEFAERNGSLHILRVCTNETLTRLLKPSENDDSHLSMQPLKQEGRPLKLGIKATGELDSFHFSDDTEYATPLGDDEVEIEVKAVGLDQYDMVVAVGQIWDVNLGIECSGVVSRLGKDVTNFAVGDRVLTCGNGWYKTYIRNNQAMFQKLPESLSFEEGATLMIAYGTAAYSIFNAARLEAGETILIHSAADVLGQAAINMAQHIGAEVLVTVSSETEKNLLKETHGIPDDHIFSNKDAGFVQGIKRVTKGQGVQVVINSLTGELLRQTWHCIAPFGRFIELGVKDIKSNTGLDMVPFLNNASFAGVNVLAMYRTNPRVSARLMADVLKYYAQGVFKLVKPLNVKKFSEIADAFRMLQSRRYVGKVVLQAVDDDVVPVTQGKKPELTLSPEATYLIPGGTGGLGRPLLLWMAKKGAKYLAVTSRSGAKDPEVQKILEELANLGVKTKVFAADIGDEAQCQNVLDELAAADFPAIKGTMVLAMNVQDSMFDTMSLDAWHGAIRPKYKVTTNLHRLLPKDLDFFICMSSSAGQIGSIAQSNYNTGNVYQDAIMHHRRAQGLAGTSIDLGWMGDIGFVSDGGKVPEIVRIGAPQIFSPQLYAVLEGAMASSGQGTSSKFRNQPILGLASGGLVKANGFDEPYWFADARFAPMRVYDTQNLTSSGAAKASSAGSVDLAAVLGAAKSMPDVVSVVCAALMAKLAKGLMMELEDLDTSRPINTYGVDSLVAVDIRAWALKDLQSVVHVSEILKNVPMVELAAHIASKSKFLPAALQEKAAA